jgi:mRNA guanylyltransferase
MDDGRTYPIRAIDAPGIRVEEPGLGGLRRDVAQLLGRNGFPGAQPVSFKREHIEELRTRE